jgi:hypothetical protein
MNRILTAIALLLVASITFSQEIKKGIPADLMHEKIIFLYHSPVEVKNEEITEAGREYMDERQTNHNRVIVEFNRELEEAATSYPYGYSLAEVGTYPALLGSGHKYILYSSLYTYDYIKNHPEEDELIVFEYFIKDLDNQEIYKVFELDEMKIYDAKLIMRRLNREIRKSNKTD